MPLEDNPTFRRKFAAAGALLGWLALVLQLYLMIQNRVVPIPATLLRFFSYFTILTNLIAVLSYTAVWLNSSKGFPYTLTRPRSLSAVTVYILIVGIIYNIILRSLWHPQGLQLIVDELLHTILPVLFLLFWWLFVPKTGLKWRFAFAWLWYPAVYIIYTVLMGALTGFYPYPFADASQLGYPRALLNGGGMLCAFYALSMVLIAIGKRLGK
jgi:hypothetical protein